ncbi:MAG: hypothetical protein Q9184_002054 [Pyrenodesmia sp. 2 TL-2023]
MQFCGLYLRRDYLYCIEGSINAASARGYMVAQSPWFTDSLTIYPSRYRQVAHFNVTHRRRQAFYALPSAERAFLSGPPFNFLATLDKVDDAIDQNAKIAAQILESGLQSFGLEKEPPDGAADWRGTATKIDLDKAKTTIRQLYRDWSAEGAGERDASYASVIGDLIEAFANVIDKGDIRVLVPGAGLGRLVLELSRQGYDVEGNEIAWHALVASNWILNQTEAAQQYSLYPFAFDFSNVISRADQLRVVKIPDIHPANVLAASKVASSKRAFDRMKMTAGDFAEIYGIPKHENKFDAVATSFFLDTAPNVIKYIQTVHNCLKPGGVWTNSGPLLWHWADRVPTDDHVPSNQLIHGHVELSVEEVLMLVRSQGFTVDDKGLQDEGFYIQNPNSMLRSNYILSHWVARKVS